ncbi:NAD(P)H-dependent oxidoreductase [Clostridium sp. 'deep sea']|uniref:NAD(P)H-dependent oxidoreductase n=1 Tax=Clostridium sp. 'deep sea' TaxID=2779445 RepID=UPI00189680CC|nr:NAD(P)H-dependent oxidoreductase [Clostridium sp. 'deep sea']QOR36704.1 NAD(P)H-dependent oxidoreductase [Clostridium sp. 'deep sea']
MKITVINGSPKGNYSVTYQSAKYLQALASTKHCFTVHHVAQRIISLEKNKAYLNEVYSSMVNSDVVLWIYPVYTFLVPYQLIKFIELLTENTDVCKLKGKYTSQLSTSRHFYDHTAYNYLLQICEDFNMNIIPGHISDMEDLKRVEGQKNLATFLKEIELHVNNNFTSSKKYLAVQHDINKYQSNNLKEITPKEKTYKITLITDCNEANSNLQQMIDTFIKLMPNSVQVLNLNNVVIKSGCIGCMHCTIEGVCVIKDDHKEAFNTYVTGSDCVIYATNIKKHSFGSLFKKFTDRQFSNGHRISSMGKPIAYLVSGNLSAEPNLREIIEARCEVGKLYLCDIVTDENNSATISHNIESLTKKIMWALNNKAERPVNFLGVGGMKVFRDLIYSMQGLMLEDHRFYKRYKLYDFPHKNKLSIMQSYLIGLMMKPKAVRKKIMPQLKKQLIKEHQTIINKVTKDKSTINKKD